MPTIVTDWFDDLVDAENNYLIITDGARVDENPNPGYSSAFMPSWTDKVIRTGQGRVGAWIFQHDIDGVDLDGDTRTCTISHVENGDQGNEIWDGSCPDLQASPAVGDVGRVETVVVYDQSEDNIPLFLSGQISGEVRSVAQFLWHLPVHDNVPPWGTIFGTILDTLEPENHGLPGNAFLEWEGDSRPELVSIEVADGDPDDVADHVNRWVVDSPLAPTWVDGGTGPWDRGSVAGGFTDTGWHSIAGEGWTGYTSDYNFVPDASPDVVDHAVIGHPDGYTLPADLVATPFFSARNARIAVKYTFRARRFRFSYEVDSTVAPPRRILARPHDARVLGKGNTYQSGARTLGGIL